MAVELGVSMDDVYDAADDLFGPIEPSPAPPLSEPEPPAIVEGLDPEVYHADINSVGCGGLSLLNRSPLHHWHECRRPGRVSEPPTDAQLFGLAVHCALLEPSEFAARFAFRPECDRRTKQGKAIYGAFADAMGDRLELNHAAEAKVAAIAEAVKSHPSAATLMTGDGKREASVYWTDRDTGVRCRCRPDFAPDDFPLLVDLKCTQDASTAGISRTAANLGWPMRAAWYVDGWRAATGEKREYVFACWEAEPPYAFAAYFVEDELLEYGRSQYRGLLKRYAECLAADKWPGYFEQIQPLLMPGWFKGGR